MAKVLLVDDEPAVRETMALALRRLGHDVLAIADGGTALVELRGSHCHELVVLDVMMPGLDGFETCRQIRAEDGIPVVMLTARGDDIDVVVGLECGADDYVVKPVAPRVLDARIRALLRRTEPVTTSSQVRLGSLVVDRGGMRASRDGLDLGLTPMEFKLLDVLAANAGQVLTRQVLLDRVWGYTYTGDSRLVDATIQRLRARVEVEPSNPSLIHTVRGFGYRLEPPGRGPR